ncbi:MAG: DUF6477 family protein [Marinosulfonomonas sp.]
MTDPTDILRKIYRPRLLIRAARFGLQDYRRERDLKRLTQASATPSPATAIRALMQQEAQLEETRKADDASYRVTRHVEVLIALMAEARLLRSPGLGSQ